MSKRKRKKIITSIISSATLVGGATAGIIYSGKTEEKKEEEKKTKSQITIKLLNSPKLNAKPILPTYNNYKVLFQQVTIFLDEYNKEVTTDKVDLSDENIKKIIQIGFYQNGEEEMQVVKMPKIIEEVPDQLPPEITSTKSMFADALSFNQDISLWDTTNVKDMSNMFANTLLFNQNLSKWNVKNVIKYQDFAANSKISNSSDNLPRFKS